MKTIQKKSSLVLLFVFLRKCFAISIKSYSIKFQLLRLWFFFLTSYVFNVLSATFYEKLFYGFECVANGKYDYWALIYAFVGIVLQTLVAYVLRSKRNFWVMEAANDIEDELDSYLDRRFCAVPYSNYNDPKIYEDILQIKKGVKNNFCNLVVTEKSVALGGAVISIFIALALLFRVNPIVAVLVLVGDLLAVCQQLHQAKNNYYRAIKEIPERRWSSAYYSTLSDRKTIKEVRLCGIAEYLCERWMNISIKMNRRTMKLLVRYTLQDAIHSLLGMAIKSIALIITVISILNGELAFSSFILVYNLLGTLRGPAGDLIGFFAEVQKNAKYTEKWLEFEEIPEENALYVQSNNNEVVEDIIFEDVSFTYPSTDKQVLHNINLSIHPGEKIAIVGANGSGKTTFVSLLNQLYQPTTGRIIYKGISSHNSLSYIRQNSMTLFQDYPRYETTIRDNIAFGNIYSNISDAILLDCIKKSGFSNKFCSLNKGLDTSIGVYYPNGIDLSGGEWQRLAIARVWARNEANLLIFDEPTSSLDAFGESLVYKQILELVKKGQTSIIISHRLSITPYVDRILVFDEGKIVEDGDHATLMRIQNGLYRSLYLAQAKLYI